MTAYVLIGRDGRPHPSDRPGTLGGHRGTRVYGRLDCSAALRRIAQGQYVAHRVFFADEEAAIAAGYRPCAVCLPDAYRDWKRRRSAMLFTTFESPMGALLLAGDDHALTLLHFHDGRVLPDTWRRDDARFAPERGQLEEYFAGTRTSFDLPLAPAGSLFQRQVWDALRAIPYGTTTSYGAIAAALGPHVSPRAVGAANGRNPIAIIVPCHRVIGSDGKLTGYAGGLDRKRALLEHEGVLLRAGYAA